MVAMSRWREVAREVIVRALREGREMGLEGESLEAHVSAAYPWGSRSNHPYKIWLSEFKIHVRGGSSRKARRAKHDLPGQGRLF
jgi:hypothetical protein